MKLNAHNATIVKGVLAAIAAVEDGTLSLSDAQSVLQGAIPLFGDDGSGIADAVRLAEADLEEIQFTTLLDEQLPAAIFRLDELRAAIEGRYRGNHILNALTVHCGERIEQATH